MTAFNTPSSFTEVILNVYHLNTPSFQTSVLQTFGIGFYHSGVEINGIEYTYGGNFTHTGTGVFTQNPLQVEGAPYKESFLMGVVKDSKKIKETIDILKSQFKANEYNLISQNCNHFSEALVINLVGKRLPSYINRASRIGYYTSCILPKSIKNQNPIPE